MLGKRTHPMIGRLSELLVSANRGWFLDVATSPRGPLDWRVQSPRGGLKNYHLGGVGLGIVAALEKSCTGDGGCEVLAKYAICSHDSSRSEPIPVNSGKNFVSFFDGVGMDMESLEDYTYVTRREPDKSIITRVYYDGGRCGEQGQHGTGLARRLDKIGGISVAKESPATYADDVKVYPTSDFLSSCDLCKKKLHGKDIFMYRGEKAFCSVECRSSRIMKDELKEQCRLEVARSADISSSSYTRSSIFSTGIIVI